MDKIPTQIVKEILKTGMELVMDELGFFYFNPNLLMSDRNKWLVNVKNGNGCKEPRTWKAEAFHYIDRAETTVRAGFLNCEP